MEEITNSFYKFGAQVDFDSLLLENLKNSTSNSYNNFFNCYFFNNNNNNNNSNNIIIIQTKLKNILVALNKKKQTRRKNIYENVDSNNSYINKKKIWTFVEQNLDLDLLYKKNKMDFYTDMSFLVTKNDIDYLDHIIE